MSDATDRNESITEVVPKALAKYLKDNVQGLQDALDEFPAPNMTLKMPCVSVITTSHQFRPLAPYIQEKPDNADIDVTNKARVKWVVGIYDMKLQLDLWARNKEERDDIMDSLFNALNPNISPMGLVLTLTEYFNQPCDYNYVGHEVQDTAERSQRDEWRYLAEILVTCKAIRERKEFIITDTPSAAEIEAEPDSEISTDVVVTE